MSDYAGKVRRRHRSLLIVEGKHEKEELFWLIFKCFPELKISEGDVWVYGTNIYKLYEDIKKEYGDDWAKDELDIDLPFIISKKEELENICYKHDFTNVILVFDYERHDPQFSVEKIMEMQNYFKDSADVGKLYLNYPMVESYLHLKTLPDNDFINRKIQVSLQPGDMYKKMVKKESVIEKAVEFPHRVDDLLADEKYGITDIKKRRKCCEAILNLTDSEIEEILEDTLRCVGDEKKEKTLKYQLKDWINKIGYIQEKQTYWEYMRKIIREIVWHNIYKADRIQGKENKEEGRIQYEQIDLVQILHLQNNASENSINGIIWVLNTCVFMIPDYNFNLIQ